MMNGVFSVVCSDGAGEGSEKSASIPNSKPPGQAIVTKTKIISCYRSVTIFGTYLLLYIPAPLRFES